MPTGVPTSTISRSSTGIFWFLWHVYCWYKMSCFRLYISTVVAGIYTIYLVSLSDNWRIDCCQSISYKQTDINNLCSQSNWLYNLNSW